MDGPSPRIHQLEHSNSLLAHDTDAILSYLSSRMPNYPFDENLDPPFVEELLDDFPELDLLEQIKLFRWYYDNKPPLTRNPRVAIRRWVANARRFSE
jgi:hypothetical protein